MRETLENRQIWIYLASIVIAFVVPGLADLRWLEPALGFMLFVTFLQVPLANIHAGFRQGRFLLALLIANFVLVPVLVFVLVAWVPDDGLLRLGIVMVLLCPCIDYVITFTHLGRGDARLLLSATPILLLAQMVLLAVWLAFRPGEGVFAFGPFLDAFLWLIAVPLMLATGVRAFGGRRLNDGLGAMPVPATALVLFIVVSATIPALAGAAGPVLAALPVYVAFAILAPVVGWAVARRFGLQAGAARAVAFSAGTRNSLVILPLALAVPGGGAILPAVIVAQTLVELLAQLVYIRAIPRLVR
ncbi:arsenic resistance protein [Falsirhodobacter xinxiangensis]|uniref:arsenic resistance protein n=1 Tax=Falsirhodobacter xinxiangensis TaxID=2530049 RepID=UPI001C6FEDCF|nr:arsenic resistance protein [Rhodobacter xinxiangensis]